MSFSLTIDCTVASLRAILAYINGDDPILQANTELVASVRGCLDDQHGSASVFLRFDQKEESEEFSGIAKQVGMAFKRLRDSFEGSATDFQAMLFYIDPEGGRRIAYDDDSLADKLAESVLVAAGDVKSKEPVLIEFGDDEALARQFRGVAGNIRNIMDALMHMSKA